MRNWIISQAAALTVVLAASVSAHAAERYEVDPAHTSVVFKVRHAGISDVYGMFKQVSGDFLIDEQDASKSAFNVTIAVASIDTGNERRDNHLRSDDFFDVKQFPTMSFKSTSVKAVSNGYEVTGNLTMHGQTKPVTFTLKNGGTTEFPKGTSRIGFTTELVLNRKEFGVGHPKFDGVLGDEVPIMIGMEGIRK